MIIFVVVKKYSDDLTGGVIFIDRTQAQAAVDAMSELSGDVGEIKEGEFKPND